MFGIDFFGMGYNTLMLQLHRFVMILILMFAAFLFGAILFTRDPDEKMVRRLKISSIVTFVGVLLLMLTGLIPDLSFGTTSLFNGTTAGGDPNFTFGTITRSITDADLGGFTGPMLFDMMEHASFVVVGLAAMIGFLVFHYGKQVITSPNVRFSVLSLMLVTAFWIATLGGIGGYLVSVLSFPTNQ